MIKRRNLLLTLLYDRYVKEGLIFRSATLDNMSQEDVDAFIETHKINTILDLRTG